MIDDPQSEVNLLNEQGITTVFSSYGSGLRLGKTALPHGQRSPIYATLERAVLAM